MVLFNGGGGWSDSSGSGARPSKQEPDLVILPAPGGRQLQLTWGWEDGHTDTASRPTSPARQPSPPAEPLASHGPGGGEGRGEGAAGCFCHKRTLCLSYK